VVSLAESRANALIGVFISITAIPAAADIGVSLANQLWSEAGGSALQLLLNVGLLIIIGALAIQVIKNIWHGRSSQ
jgi:NADH:ubiquinone oxidoreductase subunit H